MASSPIVPEVAGDVKRLQQTVDTAVFGVLEADIGDERLDRLPSDDGAVVSDSPPIDVHDERAHAGRFDGGGEKDSGGTL